MWLYLEEVISLAVGTRRRHENGDPLEHQRIQVRREGTVVLMFGYIRRWGESVRNTWPFPSVRCCTTDRSSHERMRTGSNKGMQPPAHRVRRG